jgi:pilus assembly protein CpaD
MMSFKMNTRTLMVFASLVSMPLAGCTVEEYVAESKYVPYSGAEQYPITVSRGPVSIDVSSTVGSLQPSQVNSIAAFARQASANGLSPVTVSKPSGGGKSSRVAYEVANLLAQQGVPARLIKINTYRASASSPVKVSFNKTFAKTKPCGDWSVDATNTRNNQWTPNHGCAVQSNLAAMLSNPNDINTPRTETPALGSTRVDAVDAVDGNSVAADPIAATASTVQTGAPAAAQAN